MWILLIALIILIFIEYGFSNKDVLSPSLITTFMFFLSTFMLLFYADRWGMTWDDKTTAIILVGIFGAITGELLAKKLGGRNRDLFYRSIRIGGRKFLGREEFTDEPIVIKLGALIVINIISVVTLVIYYRETVHLASLYSGIETLMIARVNEIKASGYKEIKPVKAIGKRTVGNDTAALLESVNLTISKDAYFIYSLDTHKTIAVPGNIVSNFSIDYDKIIHGTFRSLVKPAATVDDEYGREAKRVYAGVKRLRDNTLKAIEESDLQDEVKQKRIADFSNILEEKALHFEEGLQRILFFNQIMWQTRHRLNGLGRLDLILGDLYEKDIKDGILDRKITEILLDEFIKELSKYKDYKSDALEGDIGQIIILGVLQLP